MGCDLVCARHLPDQSDRLRDALRSGERGIRRLRRVFHRHSTAARRIVPPLATLIVDLTIPRPVGMGDRVVDCARLESVCAPKGHRGFESLPIRQPSLGATRKRRLTRRSKTKAGLGPHFSKHCVVVPPRLRLGKPAAYFPRSRRSKIWNSWRNFTTLPSGSTPRKFTFG